MRVKTVKLAVLRQTETLAEAESTVIRTTEEEEERVLERLFSAELILNSVFSELRFHITQP